MRLSFLKLNEYLKRKFIRVDKKIFLGGVVFFIITFFFLSNFILSSQIFGASLNYNEDSDSSDLIRRPSVEFNSGVLPWVTNVDSDKLRLYKDSLSKVQDNMSSYCLENRIDLSEQVLSSNVKTKLKKLVLGKSKSKCQSLFFEPVWVEYGGEDYFFLNVVDQKSNLVFQDNLMISLEYDSKKSSKVNDEAKIVQGMNTLFDSFKSKRLSSPNNRVKLSVLYSNTDRFLGFSLLMENTILNHGGVNIVHGSSKEWLDLVWQYLKPEEKDSIRNRANRTCSLSWYQDKLKKEEGIITVSLNWNMSESVFLNHVGSSFEESFSFKKDSSKLVLSNKDALENLWEIIDTQQKELSVSSPKVVKIDRAWVYLDKGRASGLRIYDRFIVGNESYGHVVGYYGVEEKLNSDQGYPISEGAILYIRKGQNKVRIGQEVRYDPATYPKYP